MWQSFTERSKKCMCCGIFYSACWPRFHLFTVAQKTKVFPAAAAVASLVLPCWLRFQKRHSWFQFPRGLAERIDTIPLLSFLVFVSILASSSHPEFISWSQKSSIHLRPAVSMHLIGLWMEIQSKTKAEKLRSKTTWIRVLSLSITCKLKL